MSRFALTPAAEGAQVAKVRWVCTCHKSSKEEFTLVWVDKPLFVDHPVSFQQALSFHVALGKSMVKHELACKWGGRVHVEKVA